VDFCANAIVGGGFTGADFVATINCCSIPVPEALVTTWLIVVLTGAAALGEERKIGGTEEEAAFGGTGPRRVGLGCGVRESIAAALFVVPWTLLLVVVVKVGLCKLTEDVAGVTTIL